MTNSVKKLHSGATIGIIGAGQLGKMLAQSAQKMGYRIAMYDPSADAPGFGVAHTHTVGAFDDREKLLEFAAGVDVLTYEFENINGRILEELNERAHLPQGHRFLQTTQDRLDEKSWLESVGAQVVGYRAVNGLDDLKVAAKELGLPAVLKTTRFGYDGKGQVLLKEPADLNAPDVQEVLEHPCVLEAFCPFAYEASVIVARDQYGTVSVFPASVNQHENGVLFASVAPLDSEVPGSSSVLEAIDRTARKIAEQAELVGVCGVEFFVTDSGDVYVNELAPRPHNSGHYTIEACSVSQYDQHILAVTGHPLHQVTLHGPALMVNILGQHMNLLDEVEAQFPEAMIHVYGKSEAKQQRKMGHWTLLAPEVDELDALLTTDFLTQWAQDFYD